jgi:hypothetical protein
MKVCTFWLFQIFNLFHKIYVLFVESKMGIFNDLNNEDFFQLFAPLPPREDIPMIIKI